MKKALIFTVLIAGLVMAQEYKSCEIRFHTLDGLQAQENRILAHTDTLVYSDTLTTTWTRYDYDFYRERLPDWIISVETIVVDTSYKATFARQHSRITYREREERQIIDWPDTVMKEEWLEPDSIIISQDSTADIYYYGGKEYRGKWPTRSIIELKPGLAILTWKEVVK